MISPFALRNEPARAIYNALVAEQKRRGGGIAWVVNERMAVWEASKTAAMRLGVTPLHLHDIVAAENAAIGHTDYTAKFALGVAEALMNSRPLPLVKPLEPKCLTT